MKLDASDLVRICRLDSSVPPAKSRTRWIDSFTRSTPPPPGRSTTARSNPYRYNTHTHAHTHTHTRARLTALFQVWAGTRKVKPIWILLKQETVSGSGISWAIRKSASRSRQITTPVPHDSSFLRAGCPSYRPTNSVKALKALPVYHTEIRYDLILPTAAFLFFSTTDYMIPQTFTVTSEHIRLYFSVFLCYTF